jgi:hypothetical protein
VREATRNRSSTLTKCLFLYAGLVLLKTSSPRELGCRWRGPAKTGTNEARVVSASPNLLMQAAIGEWKRVREEANDIGTAWLRIALLPATAQPSMRDLFRRYLDSRIEVYRRVPNIPDMEAVRAALAGSTNLQGEI